MHLAKCFKDRAGTALSRAERAHDNAAIASSRGIVASVSTVYFQSSRDRAGGGGGKGSSNAASKNNKSGETKDPEEGARKREISAARGRRTAGDTFSFPLSLAQKFLLPTCPDCARESLSKEIKKK